MIFDKTVVIFQTLIRKELKPSDKLIVIDEIQKIPELLDEVHSMIEEFGLVFLLTGSSARKLHKSGANMLGGRARIQYFHPLTLGELGPHFDLNKVLNRGLLLHFVMRNRLILRRSQTMPKSKERQYMNIFKF